MNVPEIHIKAGTGHVQALIVPENFVKAENGNQRVCLIPVKRLPTQKRESKNLFDSREGTPKTKMGIKEPV